MKRKRILIHWATCTCGWAWAELADGMGPTSQRIAEIHQALSHKRRQHKQTAGIGKLSVTVPTDQERERL